MTLIFITYQLPIARTNISSKLKSDTIDFTVNIDS